MDTPFGELVTSKLFRFLIGPERKEFTVHANAFSRLSQPLYALIYGGMTEARDGVAVWDDMDSDTFVRFCEFAYSGDYTTPKLEASIERHEYIADQQNPIESAFLFEPTRLTTLTDDEYLEDTCMSTRLFVEASYPTPGPRYTLEDYEDVDAYSQNYEKLFLCHIRLYVTGDKYLVRDLQALAIHKLHRTFLDAPLIYKNIENIVDAIRITYLNTIKGDRLRILLSHVVSWRYRLVKNHPAIAELMHEFGDFAFDVAEHLNENIFMVEEENTQLGLMLPNYGC
ncbi:hypothetical protein SLS62_010030 [Diatrype stigma]|uniref:BTB domain-containing protein n=1 Tax=Diatrype stigma TaxID=117547 RepID=A0AAN9YJ56_9PEZI